KPARGRRDLALATVSGVLAALAFLPAPLGFLAWFAFVPLLVALDRRLKEGARSRSLFTVGYVYGCVFYLIGTHWIALLTPVAITVPWLKYPAWWAAAFYLAFYAGFGAWLAA